MKLLTILKPGKKVFKSPRLELQAAVIGARMKSSILNEMGLVVNATFMWTDSQVTLKCIQNEKRHFSSFVMNRIHEIRQNTEIRDWYFIPGKQNIADLCTRRCDPSACKEWFEGPIFLSHNVIPYLYLDNQDFNPNKDVEFEEAQINTVKAIIDSSTNVVKWQNYSNWTKLLRHYAWIIKLKQRWLKRKNDKLQTSITFLSVDDLSVAVNQLCKVSQEESKGTLRIEKLNSLRPVFINGLLCVGGRIDRAGIPDQSKHQIILSPKHWISELLIRHVHEGNYHVGRNATLSLLRERFWVVSGKSLVRRVLYNCPYCKQQRVKPVTPLMSELPEERLAFGQYPFTFVGVDYFGPMIVKQGRKTRTKTGTAKRYGALFTCLTTRTLHLELAGDLSTDSFILALRRFRARRGNPKVIRSDNGTNFVGTERELRESLKSLNQRSVQRELVQSGIEWRFNPPLSPWMGGSMESMVKITKRALQSIVKDRCFTEEALLTFLLEVESTVNSRPLTPVSDDINDYEALTPNHFLIGRMSANQPIGRFENINIRSKWKSVQAATSMFWSRWVKEYLPSLTERAKWRFDTRNFEVGDMVILREPNVKRCNWPLARIIETFIGKDGNIRSARIKTINGNIWIRPTASLCLLESFESSHSGGNVSDN